MDMIKSYDNTPEDAVIDTTAEMLALKEMDNRKFSTTHEMGGFQTGYANGFRAGVEFIRNFERRRDLLYHLRMEERRKKEAKEAAAEMGFGKGVAEFDDDRRIKPVEEKADSIFDQAKRSGMCAITPCKAVPPADTDAEDPFSKEETDDAATELAKSITVIARKGGETILFINGKLVSGQFPEGTETMFTLHIPLSHMAEAFGVSELSAMLSYRREQNKKAWLKVSGKGK